MTDHEDDFEETSGYDLTWRAFIERLSKLPKGRIEGNIKWGADELVPACCCNEFVPFGAFDLAVGESKLLVCSNEGCDGSDRVYRRGEHDFHRGMMASMLKLKDDGVVTVPLVEDL